MGVWRLVTSIPRVSFVGLLFPVSQSTSLQTLCLIRDLAPPGKEWWMESIWGHQRLDHTRSSQRLDSVMNSYQCPQARSSPLRFQFQGSYSSKDIAFPMCTTRSSLGKICLKTLKTSLQSWVQSTWVHSKMNLFDDCPHTDSMFSSFYIVQS